MKVCIFGTGQFGHALALLARNNGHFVDVWSFRQGTSIALLPDSDVYISTLNASGLEKVGAEIAEKASGKPIITATKAFIHGLSLSAIFPSYLLGDSSCVFSGPNLASEMLLGLPTGATIAGNPDYFPLLGTIFENENFSLELSPDKKMVELMGIMKNIIAIGIGMIDGIGLGENAKGIFIARMCRDIRAFAADTFGEHFDITTSYAGIGDLFTTCSSTESRNHGFGLYFARTKSIQTATEFMNTSIEGLWSIRVLSLLLPEKYLFLSSFLALFEEDGMLSEKEDFIRLFHS